MSDETKSEDLLEWFAAMASSFEQAYINAVEQVKDGNNE